MAFALLGKLLDIEWMLRQDEERPIAELARRDRELLGECTGAPAHFEVRCMEPKCDGRHDLTAAILAGLARSQSSGTMTRLLYERRLEPGSERILSQSVRRKVTSGTRMAAAPNSTSGIAVTAPLVTNSATCPPPSLVNVPSPLSVSASSLPSASMTDSKLST